MDEEQNSYRLLLKFLPAVAFCALGIGATIYLLYKGYIDMSGAYQIFGIVAFMTFVYIGIVIWRLSKSLKK